MNYKIYAIYGKKIVVIFTGNKEEAFKKWNEWNGNNILINHKPATLYCIGCKKNLHFEYSI